MGSPLDHGAEVARKREQGSRHGLGGAVAGKEGVVADPSRRDHLGTQERQDDVAASEYKRACPVETVEHGDGFFPAGLCQRGQEDEE
jgi:hypothetical protein